MLSTETLKTAMTQVLALQNRWLQSDVKKALRGKPEREGGISEYDWRRYEKQVECYISLISLYDSAPRTE